MKVFSKNKSSDILSDSGFLESYYNELNKKAQKAVSSQSKWLKIASSYVQDGMDTKECSELLSIDGLPKDVAFRYAQMAMDKQSDNGDLYSFEFETIYGEIIYSSEINKYINASSEEDAWNQAQLILENEMQEYEPDHIVSVKLEK